MIRMGQSKHDLGGYFGLWGYCVRPDGTISWVNVVGIRCPLQEGRRQKRNSRHPRYRRDIWWSYFSIYTYNSPKIATHDQVGHFLTSQCRHRGNETIFHSSHNKSPGHFSQQAYHRNHRDIYLHTLGRDSTEYRHSVAAPGR